MAHSTHLCSCLRWLWAPMVALLVGCASTATTDGVGEGISKGYHFFIAPPEGVDPLPEGPLPGDALILTPITLRFDRTAATSVLSKSELRCAFRFVSPEGRVLKELHFTARLGGEQRAQIEPHLAEILTAFKARLQELLR